MSGFFRLLQYSFRLINGSLKVNCHTCLAFFTETASINRCPALLTADITSGGIRQNQPLFPYPLLNLFYTDIIVLRRLVYSRIRIFPQVLLDLLKFILKCPRASRTESVAIQCVKEPSTSSCPS